MKIVVVGDLHVTPSNLEHTDVWFTQLRNWLLQQSDVNVLLFLGDIFHTHAVVRQEVADLVKGWIERLKADCLVDPWFIAGNHDGISPHSVDVNAVRLLLNEQGVVLDFHESSNNFLVCNYDGHSLVFMSFVANPEEFVERYRSLRQRVSAGNKVILFCHQTFVGATYENGMECQEPSVDPSQIDADFIISGHIHKSQDLGKVFYLGTPRPISWGEVNQPKQIGVLHFSPGTAFKWELVSTKHWAPWYYEAELTVKDVSEIGIAVAHFQDWVREQDIRLDVDYVRIHVSTFDLEILQDLREELRRVLGDVGLKIKLIGHKLQESNKIKGLQELSPAKFSWEELIAKYIDQLEIEPDLRSIVKDRSIELWKRQLTKVS